MYRVPMLRSYGLFSVQLQIHDSTFCMVLFAHTRLKTLSISMFNLPRQVV
jgi:hypothetical protein